MDRVSVLRRIWHEARPYYGRLALAMLLGAIAGFAPLTLTWIPGLLTDHVLVYAHAGHVALPPAFLARLTALGYDAYPHTDHVGLPHVDWLWMLAVVGIILGSQIFGNVAGYGQSYLTAWSGQRLIATMRGRLFDRVNRLPMLEFDKWRPGDFIARFSSDLALMTDAVSISLPQMVQVTVTFVAALIKMFLLDWLLAIVLLLCAPFVSIIIGRFNKLIVASTKRAQDRVADLSSNLSEVLHNERIVKAFRREDYERDRFAGANDRFFGANMKVTQLNQTQAPVIATLVSLAIVVVVVMTVREIAIGRIKPDTAVAFFVAAGLMLNPMNRFSIFLGDFARALVGA